MTPDGLTYCGCGKRPATQYDHATGGWYVECQCGMATNYFDTERAAKNCWIRGMSGEAAQAPDVIGEAV